MSKKSFEEKWKKNLSSILEELEEYDYKKLLTLYLHEISKGQKERKSREEMPQIIIQHYGVERSITVINTAMKKIPRMDRKVQDLLEPIVKKLKELKQKEKNNAGPAVGAPAGKAVQSSAGPSKEAEGLTKRKMGTRSAMDSGASKTAKSKKTEKKDPSQSRSAAAPQKAPTGPKKPKEEDQKKPKPPTPAGSTTSPPSGNQPTGSDKPKKTTAQKKDPAPKPAGSSLQGQTPAVGSGKPRKKKAD